MRQQKIVLMFLLLSITLFACNLPGGAEKTETPNFELTLTAIVGAQTVASPQGQEAPTFTPVAESATPMPPANPSAPQVSVNQNTNCRTGPNVVYDFVELFSIGQTAEVVGKNSGVPNYWVIKRPSGQGVCWLWGQYATVVGDTSNLQEYSIPPTPLPTLTSTPAPFTATAAFSASPTSTPFLVPPVYISPTPTFFLFPIFTLPPTATPTLIFIPIFTLPPGL
ncbi:MAG: hypothetical protein LC099_04205 [Anaerolineales bacterium]|nr:hypothetical protein [Anaerolineales bacterium]